MTTRDDEIEEKCDQEGCDDAKRKKHHRLFVHERWDCHPPPAFVLWLHDVAHPTNPNMNPVTAWNSDGDRQAFGKWMAQGKPDAPVVTKTRSELMARFREAMGKIEDRNRPLRGRHGLVVTEDSREHGYDTR